MRSGVVAYSALTSGLAAAAVTEKKHQAAAAVEGSFPSVRIVGACQLSVAAAAGEFRSAAAMQAAPLCMLSASATNLPQETVFWQQLWRKGGAY